MLNVQGIDVNIGATPILRGVSLEVPSGTMCGLIGRNGAGKTKPQKSQSNPLVIPCRLNRRSKASTKAPRSTWRLVLKSKMR